MQTPSEEETMRTFRPAAVKVLASLTAVVTFAVNAQAVFSPQEGTLTIPTVLVGNQSYSNVVLRVEGDGKFGLDTQAQSTSSAAAPSVRVPSVHSYFYIPQPTAQFVNGDVGGLIATCSNLPRAGITLQIPASATPSKKVPLVIVLSGWAPDGQRPPAPAQQYAMGLDEFVSAGMAAATFEYRGCDDRTSPLVARTKLDGTVDISTSDFGMAMAALRTGISQSNLAVDTSRVVVVGTSYSANLVYTLATQHNLQGAIALAGGCDAICQMNGSVRDQPNDFRVAGTAIPVAAISGANDPLYGAYAPAALGYGAPSARARILDGIPDFAKRPAAFYTYLDGAAAHEINLPMWRQAQRFAQCMVNMRSPSECSADDR
ncbi:MAG: hypothetical protein KKB08_02880 [Gammaproteobacteria bacterium]|nr:hypothetical protein [Gammaproteobacteria bacterium]MBU1815692.1 hypothetical protein [Gammaproteobacteria bacterium]